MYFADLSPNDYFERWSEVLLSVGWLDAEHEYPRGPVAAAWFGRLVELLVEPWQPGTFAGHAPCPMCRFTGGPGTLHHAGSTIHLGVANVFVPDREMKVFVAPSTIAHYIDAHDYCPPAAFQDAVLACPPMGSLAYRKALHDRGVRR